MNGLNNNTEDSVECPLCMEPLEIDDLNFYPCTCGYQICRFCWHRIRTDENKLCPACRKEYPENPADFTPLTQEEMIALKSQKRQKDQQRKQKITENRKHLANVRVVQKNLVFVVGLPPRLADADILKKHEYFGKFGKIHKVVINPSTTYAGVQGPSASAYVTYMHNSDALRAIQSVNNIMIDGRLIKTSLGTTKYCSHFMKNQQCPKSDCMYLHELGDPDASFTKEEMHQGKHQEYEKRLHDSLLSSSSTNPSTGIGVNNSGVTTGGTVHSNTMQNKNNDKGLGSNSPLVQTFSSLTPTNLLATSSGINATGVGSSAASQNREAWPSLSVSPINNKESGNNGNKNKKHEKVKNDKTKTENKNKIKSKNSNSNSNNNTSTPRKENFDLSDSLLNSLEDSTSSAVNSSSNPSKNNGSNPKMVEKSKDKSSHRNNSNNKENIPKKRDINNQNDDGKTVQESEKIETKKNINVNNSTSAKEESGDDSQNQESPAKIEESLSRSSNSSISSNGTVTDSSSALSDISSGKSSPGSYSESFSSGNGSLEKEERTSGTIEKDTEIIESDIKDSKKVGYNEDVDSDLSAIPSGSHITNGISSDSSSISDTSDALSKLNIFAENIKMFPPSSVASFHQSLLLKNKTDADNIRLSNINSGITSQLPDLLNGIDGFQKYNSNTNDWEEALKNAISRDNKQMDDQMQQQQIHSQHFHQQDIQRLQELQKRNSYFNNIGLTNQSVNQQMDLGILSQSNLLKQQQQQQQHLQQQQLMQQSLNTKAQLENLPVGGNNLFDIFNFHKNQQQIQQQLLYNGAGGSNISLNDQLRMNSLVDGNRVNTFMEQSNSYLPSLQQQQQQLQKQRMFSSIDTTLSQQQQQQSHNHQQQPQRSNTQTQQLHQSRLSNQFSQTTSVDDDLGFDPFIETQKALAELIENEQHQNPNIPINDTTVNSKLLHQPCQIQHSHQTQQQQQQQQPFQHQQQHLMENVQRARMPPPGFNHMNILGFGGSRSQNSSKMMPFMNLNNGGNSLSTNNAQQQMPLSNTWNQHVSPFQQQHQTINESHIQQNIQNQNSSNHKGYSNNDWTTMDPAILSYRQFSSFPQQLPNTTQQDVFMQQLNQQSVGQGFNSQQMHGGMNSQTSQSQANFQHSNWLNSEQSLFMNSLTNGFSNSGNMCDKISIPMPPGIHSNNHPNNMIHQSRK